MLDRLSPHELRVIKFIARGYSDLEIAEELFVSRHTIKSHIKKSKKKLGIAGRTNKVRLIVYCLKNGIINLDDCSYEERQIR